MKRQIAMIFLSHPPQIPLMSTLAAPKMMKTRQTIAETTPSHTPGLQVSARVIFAFSAFACPTHSATKVRVGIVVTHVGRSPHHGNGAKEAKHNRARLSLCALVSQIFHLWDGHEIH